MVETVVVSEETMELEDTVIQDAMVVTLEVSTLMDASESVRAEL